MYNLWIYNLPRIHQVLSKARNLRYEQFNLIQRLEQLLAFLGPITVVVEAFYIQEVYP